MQEMTQLLGIGFGTLVALAMAVLLVATYVRDVTQKEHTVLRNFPVVGRLRYGLEQLGEYLRQYFFASDREEMPFNRSTRAWVYRLAKNEGSVVGFGSTYDLHVPGAIIFVNAPFPVLESDRLPTPPLVIGEGYCDKPFTARSVVNVSGMSFGAISEPAVRALSRGAAGAGCWMDTGEGGLSPFHLEGDCDLIMQIGTAKYGVRDARGQLDRKRLVEIAAHDTVRAFEIKLSQGAKPGKGGLLPGSKVTPLIAQIRGITPGRDSISPNRHLDIATMDQLLDCAAEIRALTGKPVGVKTAIGGRYFAHELVERVLARGFDDAPDFLVIDGGEGGSGAAPQALADHVGLSIEEALPRVVDALVAGGLKSRIRVVASGKLVTSARAAWALACGADFVNTARGFMFALGCIQSLRCHANTCPTGITTHQRRLQRGLVVEDKATRVANYAVAMNREIDEIAHSCGVRQAREIHRRHVRIVQPNGGSVALDVLHPWPRTPSGIVVPLQAA
ncbi:MAG: FMN-binding glutamate synthase family protein [Pseudomonadota bacterium]|nr:FMN-binding glutamate synthase family protein [Pseudomonadota bacterium]